MPAFHIPMPDWTQLVCYYRERQAFKQSLWRSRIVVACSEHIRRALAGIWNGARRSYPTIGARVEFLPDGSPVFFLGRALQMRYAELAGC